MGTTCEEKTGVSESLWTVVCFQHKKQRQYKRFVQQCKCSMFSREQNSTVMTSLDKNILLAHAAHVRTPCMDIFISHKNKA